MKRDDSFLVAFGMLGGGSFQPALGGGGGLYLGSLADKHWGTGPWLTLVGLMIGATAGFYNLLRIMNWRQRAKEKD